MSETAPAPAPEFNPAAEARARADVGRQVFEQYMERDNQSNDLAEHIQGYDDIANYLDTRPTQDKNGRLRDPVTGKFVSEEDAASIYFRGETKNGKFADLSEEDEYATLSIADLAMRSAKAEKDNDRTTMLSVDDELQDRIANMDLKDSLTDRDGSERENTERDNVLDRVMKLRESYLVKLNETAAVETPVADEQNETAEDVELPPVVEGGDKEDVDVSKRTWKKTRRPGPVVVPSIVEQTEQKRHLPAVIEKTAEPAPTPEKRRRGRKIAAVLLAGLASVAWFKGLDNDSNTSKPDTTTTTTVGGEKPNDSMVKNVLSSDASDSASINSNGGVGDKPYGPEYNPAPVNPEPAQAEHVFTVEVPYTEGAPTAWSWASSLGVTDIPGFLTEVIGSDWQNQAKAMKIGDSISVTDEEIAQFTHNE